MFSLLCCGTLFISIEAFSQTLNASNYEFIQPKMSYAEVLKINGAPKSKESMESKRVDVWHYDKEQVTFKEGKVIKIDSLERKESLIEQSNLNSANDTIKQAKRKKDAEEADRILKDIFQSK